jgi:hypothetical protein
MSLSKLCRSRKSRLARFKLLLICIGLVGNLICFAHDRAYAQTTSAEIGLQAPPHSLSRQTQNQTAQAEPQPAPAAANDGGSLALRGAEQRVALVIGNANYMNAPQLANPDNDAQSMAQFLNKAGFEVIAATDLTQNDMIRVMQDFSTKVAARGPNTVAMIYYAGHGVQLAGENYLIPVDAKVSSPSDLIDNSVRLVDVMATLDTIPSRMRIVVLDACRNNPFPGVNDAGRGLAIVDAPNGSIVGYSTAPGTEALDGAGGHSPYADAFLRVAREPNVPIEQLFKRVRLEVNHATDGQQTPWESSSLTSDFYFFGDTAVAATRTPNQGHIAQGATNLPGRSVRQAYDYVLAEDRPEYYQEFIEMFPGDPLCVRIRGLLASLVQAAAWHKAVLANTPVAYKGFYDSYGDSPYAQTALKLQSQPKIVPLLQPTHLIVPERLIPTLKANNLGGFKDIPVLKTGDIGGLVHGGAGNSSDGKNFDGKNIGGSIIHMPSGVLSKQPGEPQSPAPGKIVTLPGQGSTTLPANTAPGKIITLPPQASTTPPTNTAPGKIITLPTQASTTLPAHTAPGKIITLPPQGSTQPASNSGRPARVMALPVPPVGRIDGRQDSKSNGRPGPVVDIQQAPRQPTRTDFQDRRILKLAPAPTQSNLPHGNGLPGRIGGATLQPPHFAQSTGLERSGFMH